VRTAIAQGIVEQIVDEFAQEQCVASTHTAASLPASPDRAALQGTGTERLPASKAGRAGDAADVAYADTGFCACQEQQLIGRRRCAPPIKQAAATTARAHPDLVRGGVLSSCS